jgi:hypothetical protein
LDFDHATLNTVFDNEAHEVARLLLAHSVDSTKCLLLSLRIPPRLHKHNSVRASDVQSLSAALK